MQPPHTVLFHQPPQYEHLRVFGCLCYPNVSSTAAHKLTPRSRPCVFLGYALQHRGYRCLDLETRKVIISRHVIFNENYFPFKNFRSQNNTDFEHFLEEIQTASFGPILPHNSAVPTTNQSHPNSRYPITQPRLALNGDSPPLSPFNSPSPSISTPVPTTSNSPTPNPTNSADLHSPNQINSPELINSQNPNPLNANPTPPTLPISPIHTSQSSPMTSAPKPQIPDNSHHMVTRGKSGISKPHDIILTASTSAFLHRIISALSQEFSMSDLGPLHYFLGVSVVRNSSGLHLSQAAYAKDIISRAGMSTCNPCKTPVDTNPKLSGSSGSPVSNPTEYRSLAGSLQYLTFTRPDIAYAVQQCCLHMHDPREAHLTSIKRILRYVQGTLNLGLHIAPGPINQLQVYSDADWAGCPDTRRSTSGFCLYLGPNLIAWSSKRQGTVSRSSAEAEYRAVANAVAESWTVFVFGYLRLRLRGATRAHSPTRTMDAHWLPRLGFGEGVVGRMQWGEREWRITIEIRGRHGVRRPS
ncbi:hypothetical protein V2J09_000111 [Rumex salicifolius]